MDNMRRIICLHCKRDRYHKQRGLCWTCAQNPEIREKYPITSKFAQRGVQDTYGGLRLPDEATTASAGSPEKVAVLEARAKLGRRLWHPNDSKVICLSSVLCSRKKARGPRYGYNTQLTYNGRTKRLIEWAAELNMTPRALYARLSRGWPVHKVLGTAKGRYRKKATAK